MSCNGILLYKACFVLLSVCFYFGYVFGLLGCGLGRSEVQSHTRETWESYTLPPMHAAAVRAYRYATLVSFGRGSGQDSNVLKQAPHGFNKAGKHNARMMGLGQDLNVLKQASSHGLNKAWKHNARMMGFAQDSNVLTASTKQGNTMLAWGGGGVGQDSNVLKQARTELNKAREYNARMMGIGKESNVVEQARTALLCEL